MGTPSDQPPTSHPPRSWKWVSYKTFSALPFYRRAWEILKKDWLVFVWKLIVDFIGRFATAAVAILIVALFVVDFQFFVADHFILDWFGHAAGILKSPGFIAGTLGALFFASLVATALEALVVGGIWGILAKGLRDQPVRLLADFMVESINRFPEVLGLFLLKFAVGLITAFLGLAILLGFGQGLFAGTLTDVPGFALTLVLAISVTFYMAWAALSRLVVEAMGAPLILDDVDLGEAILRGAHFALDNFWSLYRLLIFALAIFLAPLGIYFVLIMANNFALFYAPALSPLTSLLRFGGEILLWTSVSVITVFFYGALFAFYHCDDEEYERQPPETTDGDDPPAGDAPDGDSPFREGATLDDFIPDEAPNRFHIDDILQNRDDSHATEPKPEPEPEPTPDESDAPDFEPEEKNK